MALDASMTTSPILFARTISINVLSVSAVIYAPLACAFLKPNFFIFDWKNYVLLLLSKQLNCLRWVSRYAKTAPNAFIFNYPVRILNLLYGIYLATILRANSAGVACKLLFELKKPSHL